MRGWSGLADLPRVDWSGGRAGTIGNGSPSSLVGQAGLDCYGSPVTDCHSGCWPGVIAHEPPVRLGWAGVGVDGRVADLLAGETELARTSVMADRRAAEQRDEADEGRFGGGAGVVTGSRHGVVGFKDLGRGARPSQLIASVRQTSKVCGGNGSGT